MKAEQLAKEEAARIERARMDEMER